MGLVARIALDEERLNNISGGKSFGSNFHHNNLLLVTVA
jgi:hypothetical protein